jgi:hypothetical protein
VATTQDCIELKYEESPRYENAPVVTPYQVSTTARYFPVQEGQIAPGPQFIDRMDELRGYEGAPEQLIDTYDPVGTLKLRGYVDDLAFLLGLAGFKGVFTAGGATVPGAESTTATGVNALNSAIVNVGDTSGFDAAAGTFLLAGAAVTFTGKTATSFTGCGAHAATAGGELVQDVVPVGASKWVFSKRVGATAKTAQFTACYADEGVWLRGQGYGISKLDVGSNGDLNAAMSGLYWNRLTVDPNIAPSYPSAGIPPVRKGDLLIRGLTGTGNIDDFNLSIDNPLVKRRSMTVASYFADKLEQDKQKVKVTGSIPKSTLTAADLDAWIAGTSFATKVKWIVPKVIGATLCKYNVTVEMPKCQIIGGDVDGVANVRQFGSSHQFWAAQDETLGYDVKITVVCSVTSITSIAGGE